MSNPVFRYLMAFRNFCMKNYVFHGLDRYVGNKSKVLHMKHYYKAVINNSMFIKGSNLFEVSSQYELDGNDSYDKNVVRTFANKVYRYMIECESEATFKTDIPLAKNTVLDIIDDCVCILNILKIHFTKVRVPEFTIERCSYFDGKTFVNEYINDTPSDWDYLDKEIIADKLRNVEKYPLDLSYNRVITANTDENDEVFRKFIKCIISNDDASIDSYILFSNLAIDCFVSFITNSQSSIYHEDDGKYTKIVFPYNLHRDDFGYTDCNIELLFVKDIKDYYRLLGYSLCMSSFDAKEYRTTDSEKIGFGFTKIRDKALMDFLENSERLNPVVPTHVDIFE